MKELFQRPRPIAVCVVLFALVVAACAEPVKLAVITTDKDQESVADLLAVELSKQAGVVLLERAEVNRILAEQKLTAVAAGNNVKLGQLLAGDGLLVLELQPRDGQRVLVARLVAVRPGVGLAVEPLPGRYGNPRSGAGGWCETSPPCSPNSRSCSKTPYPFPW